MDYYKKRFLFLCWSARCYIGNIISYHKLKNRNMLTNLYYRINQQPLIHHVIISLRIIFNVISSKIRCNVNSLILSHNNVSKRTGQCSSKQTGECSDESSDEDSDECSSKQTDESSDECSDECTGKCSDECTGKCSGQCSSDSKFNNLINKDNSDNEYHNNINFEDQETLLNFMDALGKLIDKTHL